MNIFEAAYEGNLEVLKQKIAEGVDVNSCDAYSNTVLHLAAASKNSECVKTLIEVGANPNGKDSLQGTPLHFTQSSDVCKILCAAGADVNSQDYLGNTPLHNAALFGYDDVISELLAAGSDPTIVNKLRRTPEEWSKDDSC